MRFAEEGRPPPLTNFQLIGLPRCATWHPKPCMQRPGTMSSRVKVINSDALAGAEVCIRAVKVKLWLYQHLLLHQTSRAQTLRSSCAMFLETRTTYILMDPLRFNLCKHMISEDLGCCGVSVDNFIPSPHAFLVNAWPIRSVNKL